MWAPNLHPEPPRRSHPLHHPASPRKAVAVVRDVVGVGAALARVVDVVADGVVGVARAAAAGGADVVGRRDDDGAALVHGDGVGVAALGPGVGHETGVAVFEGLADVRVDGESDGPDAADAGCVRRVHAGGAALLVAADGVLGHDGGDGARDAG